MLENLIFLTLLEFHYLLIDVFLIEFLRRLMFFNFKLILHDEKMFKNWLVCSFFPFLPNQAGSDMILPLHPSVLI